MGKKIDENRYARLSENLDKAEARLEAEAQEHVRRGREKSNVARKGIDDIESSEADVEFGLAAIKRYDCWQIQEARQRLADGTYGFCRDCGDEISGRRLEERPFATRCFDCGEAHDEQERIQQRIAARHRSRSRHSYH
ncbi:MAG: hypothetical protein A2941_00795 [Candidatus Yanofskybacteria bacterium RIFCSPLOWO2_01_FULL_49_17]|uniref:Zinc finger DksA/TraR C4-type domain-containing protein n=1 Tax=Candidatus Yanofskybacteria bacterium RIFCSPLOWO2_01_FULL_49_17 TaxID=1802700 RepID=A0A1F8GT99_9BACT|nr:MAG: hypothetical protein A2941_00795 [Candidatus Yanofskybacteria bacterium RIFCSPLOWO2_01_FULL_49_17]